MSKIVPRYLYHLTNKTNYETIKTSGVLRTSSNDRAFSNNAIYTVELTNLFKNWQTNKCWGNNNLLERLIKQVSKTDPEIVILKIPTKNLNIDKIRIRSLNQLFRPVVEINKINQLKNKYIAKEMATVNHLGKSSTELSNLKSEIINKAEKKFIIPSLEDFISHLPESLKNGISVKQRKLLQQRKEAIEYIYLEDIPASQVEKIGEINFKNLEKYPEFNKLKPFNSIFSKLLKGTPQEKSVFLLNG